VLLAVSAARVVVGTTLTLEPETRLADEATDAVSGAELGAAVDAVVEVFEGIVDDDGGFI
jgi:hypothetical protein